MKKIIVFLVVAILVMGCASQKQTQLNRYLYLETTNLDHILDSISIADTLPFNKGLYGQTSYSTATGTQYLQKYITYVRKSTTYIMVIGRMSTDSVYNITYRIEIK